MAVVLVLNLNYLSLIVTNLMTPIPTKIITRHPPTNPPVLSHLAQRNERFAQQILGPMHGSLARASQLRIRTAGDTGTVLSVYSSER